MALELIGNHYPSKNSVILKMTILFPTNSVSTYIRFNSYATVNTREAEYVEFSIINLNNQEK